MEKNMFSEKKNNAVTKNDNTISGSKYWLATSIRAVSRNLRSSEYELADSTVGVAPNEFQP
jgi:hypothetical protein